VQNALVQHVQKKAQKSSKENLDSEHLSTQVNSRVSNGVIGIKFPHDLADVDCKGGRDV
jgi:hypothetical protein